MSSSPTLPTLDRSVRMTVDRVNHSPAALRKIADPTEVLIVFRRMLDEENTSKLRLEHLLRCAVESGRPECFNDLVAWAQGLKVATVLNTIAFRLLNEREHHTGSKLKKLMLNPDCRKAVDVMGGQVN